MNIAFLGYGELANQIKSLLDLKENYNYIFFDDYLNQSFDYNFKFNDWEDEKYKKYNFIIGLGYKNLDFKFNLLKKLINKKYNIISLKHESSYFNNNIIIGKGVYIYPMCNIDKNVQIGDGVLINNSVIISHDTKIGSCTYISPGVIICGNVEIGAKCFIGAGCVISNGVKIGDNVVLGIGSVVTENLEKGTHAIGNPLKILKSKLNLK